MCMRELSRYLPLVAPRLYPLNVCACDCCTYVCSCVRVRVQVLRQGLIPTAEELAKTAGVPTEGLGLVGRIFKTFGSVPMLAKRVEAHAIMLQRMV